MGLWQVGQSFEYALAQAETYTFNEVILGSFCPYLSQNSEKLSLNQHSSSPFSRLPSPRSDQK